MPYPLEKQERKVENKVESAFAEPHSVPIDLILFQPSMMRINEIRVFASEALLIHVLGSVSLHDYSAVLLSTLIELLDSVY